MKPDRKNKLLIAGCFLAFYLSYRFAISNTIEYYSKYHTDKALYENSKTSAPYIKALLVKEKQLDQALAGFNNPSASFQNDLLDKINRLSVKNNLKVIDFREPHIVKENNTYKASYFFSIQGSFNGCLALINTLEQYSVVRHLDFVKKKNYKTNTEDLYVDVVLQRK
jgi:hypothetical protein